MKLELEPNQRVVVALDAMDVLRAADLIELLQPCIKIFKVGAEAISQQIAGRIVGCAALRGMWGMWDQKLPDNPDSVAAAIGQIAKFDAVKLATVHCLGGVAMMAAAKEKAIEARNDDNPLLLLGVTLPTGMSYGELLRLGLVRDHGLRKDVDRVYSPDFEETLAAADQHAITERVVSLALLAGEANLDGVVCSTMEVSAVREACGNDFLIAPAGMRYKDEEVHDQVRTATPYEAIRAGADLIITGRSITQSSTLAPLDAARRVVDDVVRACRDFGRGD